jgi:hypothetical protein
MAPRKIPHFGGGKIFHSNNGTLLQGIERGIVFANDGALTSHGIFKSTSEHHEYMLLIEDTENDEVDHEYI